MKYSRLDWFLIIVGVIILIYIGFSVSKDIVSVVTYQPTNSNSNVFSDGAPFKVYQIFDKETGVYYAVTEEGGICPMQTMDEGVKLVDQGDNGVIHHNMGHGEN